MTAPILAARVADAETLIWYRSAEGCPAGDAFLERLRTRGVEGRIARVGDPIDFVVTLGGGENGAAGLLERQTPTGTVAVRRLEGPNCDQVADGIALILAMASQSAPKRATPAPADELKESPKESAASKPAPARSKSRHPQNRERRTAWAVGAQGGVMVGLTPSVLAYGALFVQLEPGGAPGDLLSSAAFRGYAFFGVSSGTESNSKLSTSVAAARLEACPFAVRTGALSGSPCIAIDLGSLRASGSGSNGATDHGLWIAAEGSALAEIRLGAVVSLEAQAGTVIPFERYRLTTEASAASLYVASPVGLNAVAGVLLHIP